jgi:hypothetical protein
VRVINGIFTLTNTRPSFYRPSNRIAHEETFGARSPSERSLPHEAGASSSASSYRVISLQPGGLAKAACAFTPALSWRKSKLNPETNSLKRKTKKRNSKKEMSISKLLFKRRHRPARQRIVSHGIKSDEYAARGARCSLFRCGRLMPAKLRQLSMASCRRLRYSSTGLLGANADIFVRHTGGSLHFTGEFIVADRPRAPDCRPEILS